MPKVTKLSGNRYQYQCECGRVCTLEVDGGEKPDKLIRCWECQHKLKKEVRK